jgi:thiol-disulfide isomerase/thioredoxin
MRRKACVGVVLALLTAALPALAAPQAKPDDVVRAVRAATGASDFDRARALVADYRKANGDTSTALEALSWVARGAEAAGNLELASSSARETRALAEAALPAHPMASDKHMELALGAAIEVEALVDAKSGRRSEAVSMLTKALETYRGTPIEMRLHKNLDLLTLEGKPAPALVLDEHLEAPALPLTDLKGKVVLLFFWAHWCPDCKAESPILARLLDKYRSRGFTIVAPTQRYGYVAKGAPADPATERQYIIQIRDQYYPWLKTEAVPLAGANHMRYGVSTTPTLALVDREGIIRLYHPGQMTEEELDRAIRALL